MGTKMLHESVQQVMLSEKHGCAIVAARLVAGVVHYLKRVKTIMVPSQLYDMARPFLSAFFTILLFENCHATSAEWYFLPTY